MRNKLIHSGIKLLIASLLFSITIISAGTSLAWFYYGDNVNNMTFQILKIDSIVHMYRGNDINKNGVPDKLETVGKYFYNTLTYDYSSSYAPEGDFKTSSSLTYYTEDKSFDYLDSKVALSEDSQYNLLNKVSIDNIFPSEVYTFKFVLVNNSDCDNIIAFGFDSFTNDELCNIEARIGDVEADSSTNPILLFGDWTNLESDGTDLTLPSSITLKHTDTNVHDFWLQIRLGKDVSNTMSNKNLDLPNLRIYFQVVEE